MSSRPERHSTAGHSLLPVPHVGRRSALAGGVLLLLLGAVWIVGEHAQQSGRGMGGPLPDWLTRCFVGVGQLLTFGAGASAGARVVCAVLLVVFLVLLRRAMLARNAYMPGPVDVQELVAATPEIQGQVQGLTAQLRKHLSETNLYPPTMLPTEAPADNFLDLVGDVDLEPKKLLTSLLHLISRLRPKIAYRVCGTLRERTVEPHYGVTVTVTSYAINGSRTETIWGSTWDEVVRAAGNWVMATLVPVTRASRRPPWRGWRGRDLHPDLFAAYQEARWLSGERKFDDALECYYAALRLDPMNRHLRTQIAGIQEKLWLQLDALETYYGAMLLDGYTHLQREKHARKRFFRRRRRLWRDGLLEARYRYAVVLGIGEQTADEWCKRFFDRSDYPRRACDVQEIRQALTPAFVDRYWRAFIGCVPSGEDMFKKGDEVRIRCWLARQLAEEPQKEVVRVIFQRACVEEMQQLAKDYPRLPFSFRSGRERSGALTRSSLRLNCQVWAPLRLAWALRDLCESTNTMYWVTGPWSHQEWLVRSPEAIERRVLRALDGRLRYRPKRWATDRRLWPRRSWQDSYNAACAYAVAMNLQRKQSCRTTLAGLAVRELEDAARSDKSGYQPLMRSWLLMEDPDLEQLRKEPRFNRFERETYPHAVPDHHRPERPLYAEVMAYDQRLLTGAARVMEHTWRVRRTQLPAEAHVLAQWFSSDIELWECVYRVARNQGRVWRDRAKLLQVVRKNADPALLIECGLPSTLPELDELLDEATWVTLKESRERVEEADRSLTRRLLIVSRSLKTGFDSPARMTSPIHRSAQWLEAVRKRGGAAHFGAQGAIRQACTDYEGVWRALGEELDIDPDDPDRDAKRLAFPMALRHLHAPQETKVGLVAA
ncbi:hypothetical protein AB0K89_28765 [Streptomyces cinnamoneus]|uniref:hypothetical protein n=1 Tax=Streptomyces cinnamoneus TaxID=53446 RepID=UPI0034388C1D